MKQQLTLGEIVFICVLATSVAIFWWAYSFLYNIFEPLLKVFALNGLLSGTWLIGGILSAYIIRKPGSAILGETIAAGIEGAISQWGFSAIISGFFQGLPVELVFMLYRYRVWNRINCILAGALSAVGGYAVSYFWYGYHTFGAKYNLINLGCHIVSGMILGGLLSWYLATRLAKSGALNQFRISQDSYA